MLKIGDIIYIETPDYSSDWNDDYTSHKSIIHEINDKYYYTHYDNGTMFRIKKEDVQFLDNEAYTRDFMTYIYQKYEGENN